MSEKINLYLAGFLALLLSLVIIGTFANWGLSRQYRAWQVEQV